MKIETLKELNIKQAEKLKELEASLALQAFIPSVFDNGSIKVKVRSKVMRYGKIQYTININGKDYDSNELPSVYWNHLKSKLVKKA